MTHCIVCDSLYCVCCLLAFADWLDHWSFLFCVYALRVVQAMAKRTRGNDERENAKKPKSQAGKNLACIV